jgi:tRNA A-37 threonylcarbamoyl transferase component Bud32
MAGERLGHYEIIDLIGEGGMARVWRAVDLTLDREVALKEPRFGEGVSAEEIDSLWLRFEREAKAQAALSHNPHVVVVYAIEEIEGRRFIAMELVHGETLGARSTRGPVPIDEALRITRHLLSALEEAHAHGIVHRDIKPDNVFLTVTGAKLADFGIARLRAASTASTKVGTILGTAGYMAPEQIRGLPVDHRADIFAVGILLWQMLTGMHPFGADTDTDPVAVTYRLVSEPLPTLGRADLAWLDAVLTWATAKDPAMRPYSASDLAQALSAGGPAATAAGARAMPTIVGGSGGLPGSPTAVQMPTAQQKRSPALLVGLAVAAAVVTVLTASAVVGYLVLTQGVPGARTGPGSTPPTSTVTPPVVAPGGTSAASEAEVRSVLGKWIEAYTLPWPDNRDAQRSCYNDTISPYFARDSIARAVVFDRLEGVNSRAFAFATRTKMTMKLTDPADATKPPRLVVEGDTAWVAARKYWHFDDEAPDSEPAYFRLRRSSGGWRIDQESNEPLPGQPL